MATPIETPLQICICDRDSESSRVLRSALLESKWRDWVDSPVCVESLDDLNDAVIDGRVNTIFIDPFAFGIDASARLIISIRELFPEIVFVLYLNDEELHIASNELFRGERKRFQHYYRQLSRTQPKSLLNRSKRTSCFA